MKKKLIWLVVSSLTVLVLLAASCAPAPKEVAPAPKVAAPKEAAPAVKEVAPAVEKVAPGALEEKVAAPEAKAEMVKVSLKKVDGTVVEKLIEKPKYGGTHFWATTGNPHGWDEGMPGVPPYSSQISWMGHTQEELIQGRWEAGPIGTNEVGWTTTGWWPNPDFHRGCLAESWEFPDPETIIFHIRKGVRWHDKPPVNGREFTAEDAAYNIRRIFIELKTSTMYGMAGDSRPTDAYAKDKYTLVVKNPRGQQGATWEYVGDWMSNYPREVIEKYGNHNKWENVVGTGPFILQDFVSMSSATWVRNHNYWMKDPLIPENQLPYIDKMKVLIIPDSSTIQSALRTGKVDRGGASEEQAKTILKTSPQLNYISTFAGSFSSLGFRLDKPELPFKDIRVRRALHMAINWQQIVDTIHLGHGEILVYKVSPIRNLPDLMAAYTPIEELPPAPDGFDNKKLYTYQPEEAKRLLAEAGYPTGFKTEAIMTSGSVDTHSIYKDFWQKNLNVDYSLEVRESGVYQAMFNAKTHKEGIVCGRWNDQPYVMCMNRKGSTYNWAMIDNPKMDGYYNTMMADYFNVANRSKVMKVANIDVISNVYYYTMPSGYSYTFWWPWYKNYHGEAATGVDNGVIPKYIWIDQELKKQMGY